MTLATTAPASTAPAAPLIERIADALLHPGPVMLMTEIVLGLLFVGTIIIALLQRRLPPKSMKELWARLKSWWVMVGLTLLAVVIDQRLTIIFCGLLSFVALKEFYTLVHMRIADRRAILLSYLAVIVQYWWVYTQWYGMFLIFVPVYMFLIIPFRLVLAGQTERFMTSAGKLHWGLMAFVFGLSHLAFLLVMQFDEGTVFEAGNRGLLFYIVFLAEFNDVLQYLFGKTLGRHKMTPTISPNKTWEGFLGGLICTSILAVLLRFLTPMDVWHALGAGVLIATTGPIGGMIISAIKRDVGVKDSGNLIPGHGGVLDRVDSLCFSAPMFFHYVRYFY
jgi:phosphatidate cytidylyltransferase